MKVKRIFAPDMKTAMRRVREEIGPDAVILSNKRVSGGVEVVASPESEYENAQSQLTQERELRRAEQIALLTSAKGESRRALDEEIARARARIGEARLQAEEPGFANTANRQVRDNSNELDRLLRGEPAASNPDPQDSALAGLQAEIDQLREMLTQQLQVQQLAPAVASSAPSDMRAASSASAGSSKIQRQIFGRLVKLGLGESLAQGLVAGLEASLPVDRAWRNSLGRLAESLPVFGEDIVNRGGMIALVGPTGAGKTTTIGKLATR
ncbi:MAG: flagellar biosynthesis protein FlhF, partial [Oceanospirillaceae bacterium]|nr:flagellar biosynthesis protein FlhF [Oceanospirillaceae bacterium]